jgi:BASS family bile acid:Na+ symporter
MTPDRVNALIQVLAMVTLVELMVAIGLGATFADVVGVARSWRLVGRALLANYVCVPAVALGLLLLFRPSSSEPEHFPLIAAGFLITAVCPGAPYSPPFTSIARGNGAVAVGLMVILAGSSALLAPLLLQVLLPVVSEDQRVHIDAVPLAGTLLGTQLLPLCAGLVVRRWYPALADRLKKPAGQLSLVLNLVLVGAIFTAQFSLLIAIPLKAFAGMLSLVFASVAAGWLLGGPGSANRTALAMATAVRNVGVSLVIVTASFPGTRAVTATTAFALFQTILMAFVAVGWGRLNSEKTPGVGGGARP